MLSRSNPLRAVLSTSVHFQLRGLYKDRALITPGEKVDGGGQKDLAGRDGLATAPSRREHPRPAVGDPGSGGSTSLPAATVVHQAAKSQSGGPRQVLVPDGFHDPQIPVGRSCHFFK
jgi:hypothetical protein